MARHGPVARGLHRARHGAALPEGLQESQRLDPAIFSPATKAQAGEHDENITFGQTEEILGPVSLRGLEQDQYRRVTAGRLPEAHIAFLDEIFKSNSAILNTLLTIINERKFYQDGRPVPVNLKMLFAATNQVPESKTGDESSG